MFDEGDRPARVELVLEPGDAPAMRVLGRDDVVPAVAINVVHEDLRAAAIVAEGERVLFPERAGGRSLRGLFPPALVEHEVGAAVAVDVTDALTVIVMVEFRLLGNRN